MKEGFTLIELLVVFAFIGILTSLGMASYSAYNGSQSVQTSATNFVTLLHTAQSRALSQVVPSSCATNTISAYEVDVTPGGQQYSLWAICGGKQAVSSAKLPYQVTFSPGSTASVIFNLATGTVVRPATFSINGFGKTKTITVSQIGNVTTQ